MLLVCGGVERDSAETEGCILVTRNICDFPAGDSRLRFPYVV